MPSPDPDIAAARETRAALAVIAAAAAVRLALALVVGLGTDEIYTVAVSRRLSASYFDHPPLHQWLTHASVALFGESRLARLPFIALFALAGWLTFLTTRRLYGAAAGFWAVVTLNLSAFFVLSAGSWIVPDGPLLAALALVAWLLARLFVPMPGERPNRWLHWLAIGAGLGLAGLAKYHAALVGLGLAGFLLATPAGRAQLRHPAPWLAAVLAAVIVSPVIAWNAANGWASFAFQAGRSQGAGFAPWLVPASLLAQAGWLLPWIAVPLVVGLWLAWKGARDSRLGLLLALGLPTIVVFSLLPAFGNLGLPHWAMPGWFLLMPLAGRHLAALAEQGDRPRRWAVWSAVVPLALVSLFALQAATGFAGRLSPAVSRNDPTLELFGWDGLAAELARLGLPAGSDRIVIADSWQNAGRMAVALGPGVTVLPGTADPRHFAFLVDQRALAGRDAVIVVRARRAAQMRQALAPHVAGLGPDLPFALGRGGLPEIPLVAIAAEGFRGDLPWPYGHRP